MPNILSRPTVSGQKLISPSYQTLGVGLTNTVFLIGHADTADPNDLNNPYHVINMQRALDFLKQDFQSPLVRGLLETYNAGCKDIWIMAVAPMSEYESNPARRKLIQYSGKTFYQRYYERLTTAYTVIKDHDFFELIVPLEAPFYDTTPVDFATQLATFCSTNFATTGSVSLGFMGTRVPDFSNQDSMTTNYNDATLQDMIADTRFAAMGDKGMFLFVTVGEGTFMHSQATTAYVRSLEAATAALVATTPLDRSIINLRYPTVLNIAHRPIRHDRIEQLAQKKLNTIDYMAPGRRGMAYQVKLLTDNTAGSLNTDYYSLSHMRVVLATVNEIRRLGHVSIGGPSDSFKSGVKSYLDFLKNNRYIQNYSLSIQMETVYKAIVDVAITPLFGVKQISFKVEVGPGD